MSEVAVPGPEPDWEPALHNQPGKRSPVQQYASSPTTAAHREIAVLKPAIGDIARRLRLTLERASFTQGGPAAMAYFEIREIRFGIYRTLRRPDTVIGLHEQEEASLLTAMDVLLETLGIDWRAVAGVATGPRGVMVEPVLDEDARPAFPDTPS